MIIPNLKNIITKEIVIKEFVDYELITFIQEHFSDNANGCVICDYNTEKFTRYYENYLRVEVISLEINSHHADDFMIEACDDMIKNKNIDYFIACGAGTIHDITRVIAYKYNKPFISFPTAASVDGFVSSVAPITTKSGMKITLPSAAPIALFADINIIANAPQRLTYSGIGDILGKFISLTDWRIANLLLGEEMDEQVVNLEFQAAFDAVYSCYNGEHDEQFYTKLLEALVLSGLCMQSVGNSRPASGAEHHIAHFFEMNILEQNNYLHGENVAIGALLCHELYQTFLNSDNIKFIENYDIDEEIVKKYYGSLSDYIIKENQPAYLHKITPEIFYKNLDKIKNIIEKTALYRNIPMIVSLISKNFNSDISSEKKELVLKLAPYVRNRFTLLKLCRCLEF